MIMKAILIFVMCVIVSSANAQTLKDALFSGRLKTDSSSTIKKNDSLKLISDSLFKIRKDSIDKARAASQKDINRSNTTTETNTTNSTSTTAPEKSQTWKQFIDEYTETFKKEVLPSSKIPKGTYSILIEYTIEVDGNITTNNVYCTPDNSYLVQQIKTRMMINAPQLSPVLMSNGKPRKALKKQSLTFVKEKD